MSEKSFFTKEFIKEKLVEKYEYLVTNAVIDIREMANEVGCFFEFYNFSMLEGDEKKSAKENKLIDILDDFEENGCLWNFPKCLLSGRFNQNHDFWFWDSENADVIASEDDPYEILANYLYGFADISIYNFFNK